MGGFIRGMLVVMCGFGAPKHVWVLKMDSICHADEAVLCC